MEHYYIYVLVSFNYEMVSNSSFITVNKEIGEVDLKHFSEMPDERTIRSIEKLAQI